MCFESKSDKETSDKLSEILRKKMIQIQNLAENLYHSENTTFSRFGYFYSEYDAINDELVSYGENHSELNEVTSELKEIVKKVNKAKDAILNVINKDFSVLKSDISALKAKMLQKAQATSD